VLDEDVGQNSHKSQEDIFNGEEIKETKMFSKPKRKSQNLISNFNNNINYQFNEDSSISLGL
jgi:hypothetical protein